MKNTHKIVASLAGVVLLIAAAAVVVVSFWTFSQIKEAAEARKHTYTVIIRAETLLSELKDAETGQRGYSLTGDKAFLEPYLAVRDSISGHLEELRQLTLISAGHKHLDAMAPLIVAKLAEMSHVIALRRNHDMAAVIAVVDSGQGKRLMDSIRAEKNSFIQIEEDALAQHEAEFQSNTRHLLIVIVTTSLLTLLFALSFVYLIYRETQHRLKNLVYLETQHLLEIQEDTNKQLQQANVTLQVSEEKLAVTLNSIGDGVIATDAEGRVTLLNPLAEQLTAWTQAEAIGRPVDEIFRIINQETRQPSTMPVMETLAHGTIHGLANHTILIARAGSECAIDDSCAPIRNRDGQVVGAVLVFRDVTERMEIEIGLEKTRKELEIIQKSADEASEFAESIINTVREPLIALDQDLRVVSVSRSFYEVFKVNPEETVGQLIYDLGNKQWDIPKLRELLETILPQKTTFDKYEVDHDFADIGRRIMLLNARQIQRVWGKERIILLAIEDITEQMRLQRELAERTRDAEAANRAKSVFLANMSHEIRTPMTAILGFSQLMQRDPAATPQQLKQLDVINRSGEHLLTIINDILEISKIEAGRIILNPTTFDLHALVNDLETMFRVHTDAKKLHLIVERVGELPRYVVADEAKVRQVLSNLLGNAVKFTQTGGIALRVRTSPGEAAGLRLVAEVEDTGQGISEKDIAGLFQRFEQTESGQKIRTGTGLGLAISRGFARLMGGDITVSSQEGQGSIFHVEIGLSAGDVAGLAKKAADSRRVVGIEPGHPKYRVLIADDNKENRDLLAQTLGPVGFELRQATDGEEAIREFQAWQPDIILMDLRMPVMDGREATRRIKSIPKGKETSVIVLTASSFEDGRRDMTAIGVDGYIRKPFRESELFENLAHCLNIKYVYAEEAAGSLLQQSAATANLPAEVLSRLPKDLVQGIRDAASGANLKLLLTLISQLETHDAQAAEGLRELANHYDYEAILRVFPGDPA